ncbi:hypothetical protein G7085_16345 [Tessaracoccus sp. HDW20]|uniref:DUF5979 domain-containing protein n=1 Tax=Tessaracoccus coleopterorum TaxID=2714950 RepID=UPI0018D35CB0|nr:DUF5979 domain-containing protein [Tessaracoccus coleopterorum]NHB85632.1 hypothetical protein [Tessaracoccus coleopterorum]
MKFTLADGGSRELTGLPAGAACTVTESAPLNIDTVTTEWTAGDESGTGTGLSESITLAPDAEGKPANTQSWTNDFATSELWLTKIVTGDGADEWGQREFTFTVSCVDGDDNRVWYKEGITLGGEHDLTYKISDVWADATCTVTETRNGGATDTVIAPRVRSRSTRPNRPPSR